MMAYLIIVVMIVILLNVRASLLILRSPFWEGQRKAIQLVFVWLVPFIGALIAMQVSKDNEAFRSGQVWADPGFNPIYAPDDCTDVHLHHSSGCE
jgi:hypothetical protein